MKKTSKILSLLLAVMLIFSMTACFKSDIDVTGLWEDATYTKDTTLGGGAKTIEVKFSIDKQSITVTLKTDKDTLGEALYEHSLINDPSFFDTVNGIKADYNENQSWWKVTKDEKTTAVGVGELTLTDGDHYEIIYTIGF